MTYEEGIALVGRARDFAVAAHGSQKYNDEPYVTHLDDVVRVLVEFGFSLNWELLAAGFLHDVAEDTDITVEVLAQTFPATAVRWADKVTGRGHNRKTRNADMYAKAPTEEESAEHLASRPSCRLIREEEGRLGLPAIYSNRNGSSNSLVFGLTTETFLILLPFTTTIKVSSRPPNLVTIL